MKWILGLMAVFVLAASAAGPQGGAGKGISGTWKATAEGPNGSMERTFVFKVDGNEVTGETSSSLLGKSTISNGKVDGDTLTFTIAVKYQDNEMTLNYKGKVNAAGDEMHLTVEIQGQAIEWIAKRVS